MDIGLLPVANDLHPAPQAAINGPCRHQPNTFSQDSGLDLAQNPLKMLARRYPDLSALLRYSTPYLIRFPSQRFWVDYDAEADVLYVGLKRPQKATDSVMTDNGVLLRYREDQLVGVTILEASARMAI